jgi:hypothetical protein
MRPNMFISYLVVEFCFRGTDVFMIPKTFKTTDSVALVTGNSYGFIAAYNERLLQTYS